MSKTGKHGHAKVMMSLMDLMSEKNSHTAAVIPATHTVTLCKDPKTSNPEGTYDQTKAKIEGEIAVFDFQLIDISSDGFLTLMDMAGEVCEHMRLPAGGLGQSILASHQADADIVLTVWQSFSDEQVVAWKRDGCAQ